MYSTDSESDSSKAYAYLSYSMQMGGNFESSHKENEENSSSQVHAPDGPSFLQLPSTDSFHGMHTFIIEYKDDSVRVDVASHSELEEKIRGLFKVSNFKLKIKDPEFDYFRNLNSREEIVNKSVLRVVVPSNDEAISKRKDHETLPLDSTEDTDYTEPLTIPTIMQPLKKKVKSTVLDGAGASTQSSSVVSSKITPSSTWCTPYYVPRLELFPDWLKRALDQEASLNKTTGLRSALWNAVLTDVSNYTLKFTGLYQKIIEGLCVKWNYLKGPKNEKNEYPYEASCKAALKSSFQIFMQNKRRRGPLRDLPEVVENRKRYLKKPTMVRYTDSVPNHYGIKNYAPERVAGETDESIKNHIETMQDMMFQTTATRNLNLQKSLMNLTFPERRVLVTNEGQLKTASQIKEIYPLLFDKKGIEEEFHRLMEFNAIDKLNEELLKYVDKLSVLTKSKESELVKIIRREISMEEDPVKRMYMKKVLSILVVVEQLSEKTENLFYVQGMPSSFPKILLHGHFTFDRPQTLDIIVEGVKMASIKEGLLEALCVQIMGFYVFNIIFPRELKSTLAFLTKYIFGIKDITLKCSKVEKLWNKLIT